MVSLSTSYRRVVCILQTQYLISCTYSTNWIHSVPYFVSHKLRKRNVINIRHFMVGTIYKNDLPKIINRTAAPIIVADDTSILFAHSNLVDFNKNIHIVFATWNKLFRANQLSVNFNKTNYLHFTSTRNMSDNLKIGFNNNLITYTKFLRVIMDNTLSWNNHIYLLLKKLSSVCHIIRNAKIYMTVTSLKMIYHVLSKEKTNVMPLILLFYSMLNMFRPLIRPSSGACD